MAGSGDPDGLGWVGRISTLANESGRSFSAVNHGAPGATSIEIVRRFLDATADPRNHDLPDTKVVFQFGTNDVINDVPSDESLEALDDALDRAEHLKLPVFVVGPPPVGDLPDADSELSALSFAFASLCELRGVPFLETHPLLSDESVWTEETAAGDGSHPRAGGYQALADFLVASSFIDWIEH